eukprot:INCI14740.4.p1 GENE.INCI14740.4~~INCI14740.4.p1  ORF type:complete len:1069 (-),score=150.17 INCI14740.4:136-3342(-)
MGNRTPSITVESLKQVQSRAVNHFESWAYWLRLTHLPWFKRAVDLDDQVFHTVLVFLQMGNFTAVDGSVRSYYPEELMYAGGTLEECRARVTVFVKLVINIVIAEAERLPADDETLLLKALKALVGNKTWNVHGHDPVVFRFIHALAASKLRDIAIQGEKQIFPKYRGSFSDIPVPPNVKHRLDDPGVLPFKTLRTHLQSTIAGIPRHDHEFMVVLEYLAKLVDPFFQFAARAIAEANNGEWRAAPPKTCARMAAKLAADYVDEPWPRSAANIDMSRCAMTFNEAEELKAAYRACSSRAEFVVLRCKNKLSQDFNAVDNSFGYRSVLANLLMKLPVTWGDLIEATPDAPFLPRLFRIGQEVLTTEDGAVGVISRFRNGYVRLKYPSQLGSSLTIQNGSFTLGASGSPSKAAPLLPTRSVSIDRSGGGGGTIKGPSKILPERLLELNQEMVTDALDEWRRVVPDSLKHVKDLDRLVTRLQFTLFTNKAFLTAPARFIVEIQFLLADYLAMRKRSHIWYKLYRTDDVDNLVSDFYSYAGINRASSFLLEGLKQRDAKVLRHFSRLPTLPPEQVYLPSAVDVAPPSPGSKPAVRMMRDNETGNTVLHYFASAADRRGRYNFLLEKVLSLPDIFLDDLDSDGQTPYTLAKRWGNAHVLRRLCAHPSFGARSVLNVFYHETGGSEWAIHSRDGVNGPVFFDNGGPFAVPGSSEKDDDNVNAVGTPKNLKDIMSFFVLGSPALGHRRTGSDSSASSADTDSVNVEEVVVPIRSQSEMVRKGSLRSAIEGARKPFVRSATDISRKGPVRGEAEVAPQHPARRQKSVSFESQSSDGESQSDPRCSRLARPTATIEASEPLIGARLSRPDGKPGQMQHRAASADDASGIDTSLAGDEILRRPLTAPSLPSRQFLFRSISNPRTDPENASDGWLTPIPLGQWRGIVTKSIYSSEVTELQLCFNNLAGAIPSELGLLSTLTSIRLVGNVLTGAIPLELGSLVGLETLDLGNNSLTGRIPTTLGQLGSLRRLNLGRNQLTGSLPLELCTGVCRRCLEQLDLHGNGIDGTIPEDLQLASFF